MKDNSIDGCLGMGLNTCNEFLEEDCSYDFSKENVFLNSSTVPEAKTCQTLCTKLDNYCKYWVYQKNTCYILKSGERNCSAISGPKFPGMKSCPCKNYLKPFDFLYVIGNLLLRFFTFVIKSVFRKKILLHTKV